MADIVAIAHHHRQRDEAHGDHRGRDRAGDGAEDGADDDHRIAQPAPNAAEELAEAIEQILGEAALFEDDAHEGEERDGEQQLVGDDAIELVGEVAHEVGIDQPQLDGDDAEEQADGGEREGGRVADHQKQDEPAEHHRRQILAQDVDHCSGFS